jgi:cell division protein FtsL
MSRIKLAVALVSLVVCLGACRVALSSATVSVLQDNSALQSTIETSQATESELKINRSVLSASSRIVRIATQNYGMTLAASTDEMSLGDTSQATATASDGDVAQASAAADSSPDES